MPYTKDCDMSKITFKSITVKNFRSFGNTPFTLSLDDNSSLICSRENGDGKSTVLTHALTYVLYDKAYGKGQKKTTLVNSNSGKDCLVELTFIKNGNTYLIRRGMKPSVFDIVENGIRILDCAALSDYQAVLSKILGIDEKVFYNTILLGKDKFVPFIEMSAAERRNYVEQVLDLDVFTNMNLLAKEDLKGLQSDYRSLGNQISLKQNTIQGLKNTINTLQSTINAHSKDMSAMIDAKEKEKHRIAQERQSKEFELEGLRGLLDETIAEAYEKLQRNCTIATTKIAETTRAIRDIETKDHCTACNQTITQATKDAMLGTKKPDLEKMQAMFEKINTRLATTKQEYLSYQSYQSKCNMLRNDLRRFDSDVNSIDNELYRLRQVKDNTRDLDKVADCRSQIEVHEKELLAYQSQDKEMSAKIGYYNTLLIYLKDDGLKSKIIEQYIPRLNIKVNEYLDRLNLFVNIKIDSEFNIEMFSPTRKGQSIQDLSSGQIRRIDLALLLAWREIARLKSSVDTNLLVLDETLENLSSQGVNDFMSFYNNTYNQDSLSLFVVSQRKDEFSEYFDNVLEFTLKDGCTVLV